MKTRLILLFLLSVLPARAAQVLIAADTTLPGGRTIINDNFTELYARAFDPDVTIWAGVTPSANGQALVSAANYAAMRALLDLEAGTDFLSVSAVAAGYQPLEATLTDIADGTIAENLVNTVNPWADNEVADSITVTGSVASGTVVASGFNGNLTTTDDTVQEIAQKLDDLSVGATDFDALTEAVEADADADDVFAISIDGTEKKITLTNLVDLLELQAFTFSSIDVTTLNTTTLTYEGATADAFETTLGAVDPTADNAINLPNASGTVALESSSAGTHATPNTGAESPTWTGTTHVVWQGDAATINLPAAAGYANRGIIIYSTASSILTIEPNASEVIVRDGTAQTGGVNFTLSAAAGNYVALISDGTRWITLGFKGTLSVGS